jgi:hypothetical protein
MTYSCISSNTSYGDYDSLYKRLEMRLLNSVLAILSNNGLCQVQSIAFSADPLCPITYTHSLDLLLAPLMGTTVLLVLQLVHLFPFSVHPFTVTWRILKLVFCFLSTWATLTCLPYPTHIIDSVVDTLISLLLTDKNRVLRC